LAGQGENAWSEMRKIIKEKRKMGACEKADMTINRDRRVRDTEQ
jgi:hypothetical protein